MPSSIQKTAFLLGAAFAITLSGLACFVERAGSLIPPLPSLSAEPNPSCPGEPVTISWDLHLPQGQEWCDCVNGSFRIDPITCAFTSECPGIETCRDGFCCDLDLCGGECGNPTDSCTAGFDAEINAGGAIIEVTTETGSTTVFPTTDTTVTLSGAALAGTVEEPWPDRTITLDVIEPGSTQPIPLIFPWICATTNWEFIVVHARSFFRIVGITNTSPYRVRVTVFKSDYQGPPIDLNPGQTTTEFNGIFGGDWVSDVIDPTIFLTVPGDCLSDVTASDRLPNLTLDVTVECLTP